MYKNFWWPLATTNEVSGKPMRVTALQQEFVLYRLPDGKPQVMSDLCVHRGGALSDGWLEGTCLVCPYHGWNFASDGACVKIPANLAGVPVPRKARVDSYPTVEKYGFVWAFLGDVSEPERVPMAALAGVPADAKGITGSISWQAPYDKVIAHFGDIGKAFLAIDGEFAGQSTQSSDSKIAQTDWAITISSNITPPKRIETGFLGLIKKEVDSAQTSASSAMHFPCITQHSAASGHLLMAHLPIDDKTTMTKWSIVRTGSNTSPELANKRMNAAFEALRGSIESDAASSNPTAQAFARMCHVAIQRGWGIDIHMIQADFANIKAVVIPSPARREIPELAAAWVMKEVPVVARTT